MDEKRSDISVHYDDDADDTWRNSGWADLPFFLATARAGTFRAAAERLKTNHATVDRHIRALEATYGVRLFDRKARGVSLTAAGRNLLIKAEVAEGVLLEARRSVSGLDSRLAGPVHVNISSWNAYYILASKIPSFHARYPDIDLKVTVSDRVEDLASSPADVSYRAGWSVEDNVVGRRVYTYHSAILASEDYIERHWATRGPSGEGLTWIGQSALWPNPQLEELNLFPAARRVMDVRDPILINELLREGVGMAVVPLGTKFMIPNLVPVPETPIAIDRSVWILLQSDLKRTARIRAVVEFLSDCATEFFAAETEFAEKYPYKI